MFFEGKYYKHQAGGNTLCLIEGRADDGRFLQIIADGRVHYYRNYRNCRFSDSGIYLDLPDIKGEIKYTNLTPLKSDIMGIFRFFPMQCRHSVVSMRHDLSGGVEIGSSGGVEVGGTGGSSIGVGSTQFGGTEVGSIEVGSIRGGGAEASKKFMDFSGGEGYIEGDKGRSFPKKYLWLHCNDFLEDCSIMVSAADIPFLGFHFMGCICAIVYKGKEYRLATYHGVKIKELSETKLVLVQKKLRLEIEIAARDFLPLKMPIKGKMSAIIHECNSASASFRLYQNDNIVFDLRSENTSFEYNF